MKHDVLINILETKLSLKKSYFKKKKKDYFWWKSLEQRGLGSGSVKDTREAAEPELAQAAEGWPAGQPWKGHCRLWGPTQDTVWVQVALTKYNIIYNMKNDDLL